MAEEPRKAVEPETAADAERVVDLEMPGAFMASLVRNNRQIRKDRAISIAEDAMMLYGRTVEDLAVSIRRMKRDRENMLDMSPDNTLSLKLASDFNSEEFVKKDIELGVKIRNAEIQLEIAQAQFKRLFEGGV